VVARRIRMLYATSVRFVCHFRCLWLCFLTGSRFTDDTKLSCERDSSEHPPPIDLGLLRKLVTIATQRLACSATGG
jgi:hypothetical protein